MYDAVIGITGAIATSATLTHNIKKHIPSINNNFALRNGFKLARSGITTITAFNLMQMNMYKKYDELKADDGIPNKKELLEAQAEKYEARHTDHLKCINIIKERADYKTILYGTLPDDQFNRKQLLAMKILPKTWFNKALVMNIIFHAHTDHPSDIRRAMRFRKRIAKINNETIE